MRRNSGSLGLWVVALTMLGGCGSAALMGSDGGMGGSASGGHGGHGGGGQSGAAGNAGGSGGRGGGGGVQGAGGAGGGGSPGTGGNPTGGTGGQQTGGAGGASGGTGGSSTGGTGGGSAGTAGHAAGGSGGTSTGTGGSGSGGNQTGGTGGTGGIAATGGTAGAAPPVCDPTTQHTCSGACVSNSSIATCGSLCAACTPPAGATATCDGTNCGFTCGGSTPKQCLAAGICVASTGCCSNTDCPTNAGGQTGTCDTGTHTCNYACTGSTKSCTTGSTTVCIPTTGCCATSDCTGTCMSCATSSHTCVAAVSMADPNGRCAGTCDSTGACKSTKGQSCTATSGGCISGSVCSGGYCCAQSCGTDATCAGSCAGHADGSCAYPTTACGTAGCSGNMSTAQGVCTSGTCVTPSPMTCPGGLICGTSTCKGSCGGDLDCVSSSNYCSSAGTCVAKQGTGAVCTANDQCVSNMCGGRCCPGPGSCSCPQPSTGNLVPNAGFDTGLGGWMLFSPSPGAGDGSWVSDDASSCPASGAASIVAGADPDEPSELEELESPCMQLSASTTYDFGMKIKGSGSCSLSLVQGSNCGGTAPTGVTGNTSVSAPGGSSWSTVGVNFGSGTAVSGYIYCKVALNSTLEVDMVYITPAPGTY
ncbi:MAG TPA: hypothetical protein VMT03_20950 [Polyangia bacterium]|nr:hypothetical protein [Polyangia bacterium]